MGHVAEDGLVELAGRTRAFLEPLWIGFLCDPWSSTAIPLSTGACRVSSEFLAAILPQHGYDDWSVHGGEGAFTDASGVPRDHYWVSDGKTIIDITADQFGLPPVVTGAADTSRYRVGPARPLSDGGRSETGCVDIWVKAWGRTGGVAPSSPMNAAAMANYAGPSAGALALLLHDELGLPIFLLGTGGPLPHPVVWDGGSAFDARGLVRDDWFKYVYGVGADTLVPTDPDGVRALLGPIPASSVDEAYQFAMCHPALEEALRQARYSRIPEPEDDGSEPDAADDCYQDAEEPAFHP